MNKLLRALVILAAVSVLLLSCVEREQAVQEKEAPSVGLPKPGAAVAVSEVLGSPQAYRGGEVTVSGKARPGLAFEFVAEQPYLLDDGTGQIWVITRDIMPAEDETVTVTGTVEAPYQIRGRRYDVAIIEVKRQ